MVQMLPIYSRLPLGDRVMYTEGMYVKKISKKSEEDNCRLICPLGPRGSLEHDCGQASWVNPHCTCKRCINSVSLPCIGIHICICCKPARCINNLCPQFVCVCIQDVYIVCVPSLHLCPQFLCVVHTWCIVLRVPTLHWGAQFVCIVHTRCVWCVSPLWWCRTH